MSLCIFLFFYFYFYIESFPLIFRDIFKSRLQVTQKYYIIPVTLQEIMLATDEGTCQLRKAIEQGELDPTLIQNDLEEWFRQTKKFYLT